MLTRQLYIVTGHVKRFGAHFASIIIHTSLFHKLVLFGVIFHFQPMFLLISPFHTSPSVLSLTFLSHVPSPSSLCLSPPPQHPHNHIVLHTLHSVIRHTRADQLRQMGPLQMLTNVNLPLEEPETVAALHGSSHPHSVSTPDGRC